MTRVGKRGCDMAGGSGLGKVGKGVASGVVGPGPRHAQRGEYEANKADILAGRLRISVSTGKVFPVTDESGRRLAVAPSDERRMSPREIDERRTWCFNLPLMGQRARIEAIRRVRDAGYELTEEQQVDIVYLRELLQ